MLVSSANKNTGLETTKGRISLTNIVNSTGPNTEPCGTPLVTEIEWEMWPLSTTFCYLFDKQSFIHIKSFHEFQKRKFSVKAADGALIQRPFGNPNK